MYCISNAERESGGRGIRDVYEGGGGESMIDEGTNVYLCCNKQKGKRLRCRYGHDFAANELVVWSTEIINYLLLLILILIHRRFLVESSK